ncbi:DNA polymerase ligase domain-containing protein [Penicillium ucsense]|uniref:DNA polymerase ligase domain-containing protein n=1 Tax=Penicillium ucsense TaxID=2839758 RepID=A0A8J8W0X3_9EURO|nr:DNA polymerase ligase domain-containing protein [Penicillium ucsense]KAF7735732.1 DNA polymerase ligase domain-containing protein [Penicillium ucsense]
MKRPVSSDSDVEVSVKSTNIRRRNVRSLIASLRGSISPPPRKKAALTDGNPNVAAIEAGDCQVKNHLEILADKLRNHCRPLNLSHPVPRLPIEDYVDLYRRNCHPTGRHFVIHQHDHPIAGPHYDLRLQFSETSSVSWSIMYGLPGDPNSERLNRNATETRVHCLWNHLIETASAKTGSLIIWDTGEYEILPYENSGNTTGPQTDESGSDRSPSLCGDGDVQATSISDSAKLKQAFHSRKIRIRLHGTRLPKGYTVLLRMDKSTDFYRPVRKGPKRRRRLAANPQSPPPPVSTSDSDSESQQPISPSSRKEKAMTTEGQATTPGSKKRTDDPSHFPQDEIDYQIRKNNAYPGSFNTIGSIHQRTWYLSMDRAGSGFEPQKIDLGDGRSKRLWVRSQYGRDSSTKKRGFEPFRVHGPQVESSVVTGRLGQDVLEDEGVQGFIARKGWRPVLR